MPAGGTGAQGCAAPVGGGEALLAGFAGTLLLASHDRRLVDRVATRVWPFAVEGGLDGRSVVPT